jgi:cytochrome c-type biogenesis protein CcmH
MDAATQTLLFWAIAGLAAAAATLWMLARARTAVDAGMDAERSIYVDQLAELDRDRDRGLIEQAQYEAARLEIGRRAARALADPAQAKARSGGRVALFAALAAPLCALGLYLVLGSPGTPDQPFEARRGELLARDPASLQPNELIALLEDQTRRAPNDPQPHIFLGELLANQGRDEDALRAFQAALRRDPRNAQALSNAGAMIVKLDAGTVGPDALQAFMAALAIDPKAPVPQFYVALSRQQQGDQTTALSLWRALYQSFPPQDQRRRALAARIAEDLAVVRQGPDGQTAEAAATMTDAERRTFIASMIEARASKAAANPQDLNATLSLARVRAMTGDVSAARAALDRLEAAHPGDPLVAAIVAEARASVDAGRNDAAVSAPAPSPGG